MFKLLPVQVSVWLHASIHFLLVVGSDDLSLFHLTHGQPTGNLDDPWKCSNCWSLGLCCHAGLSGNAYTKRLALCQSATKSLGRLSGLRWKERLLCSNLSSSPFSLTKQQQQSTLTLDLDHLGGDNGPFVMSFGDSCAKLPKNRETQFPTRVESSLFWKRTCCCKNGGYDYMSICYWLI